MMSTHPPHSTHTLAAPHSPPKAKLRHILWDHSIIQHMCACAAGVSCASRSVLRVDGMDKGKASRGKKASSYTAKKLGRWKNRTSRCTSRGHLGGGCYIIKQEERARQESVVKAQDTPTTRGRHGGTRASEKEVGVWHERKRAWTPSSQKPLHPQISQRTRM